MTQDTSALSQKFVEVCRDERQPTHLTLTLSLERRGNLEVTGVLDEAEGSGIATEEEVEAAFRSFRRA